MEFKDFPLMKLGHEIQMVGVIYRDSNDQYEFFLPDEQVGFCPSDTSKCHTFPLTNEDWTKFLLQTDTLETEVSQMKNGKLIKAIVRKSQRQIDQNISWAVYRRDNYACVYCGRNDVPLTVDHIDLWEDGGRSIEENLLTCCKNCNKTRGNMKYEDWIQSDKFDKIFPSTSLADKKYLFDILHRLKDLRTKRTSVIKSR